MLTRFALALCLFGTACATEDYDGARVGGRSLEKSLCPTGCSDDVTRALGSSEWFDELGGNAFVSSPPSSIAFEPACDLVPNKGLCAFACDANELAKHVLSGCITIACGLDDGRTIVTGACANDFTTSLTPY